MKQIVLHPFFCCKLITYHCSPAGKKQHIRNLPFSSHNLYVFEKTRVSIILQTLRGKQKYQVTNVGVEKIKLSRSLVQRINKFKMNEIQRKHHSKI